MGSTLTSIEPAIRTSTQRNTENQPDKLEPQYTPDNYGATPTCALESQTI